MKNVSHNIEHFFCLCSDVSVAMFVNGSGYLICLHLCFAKIKSGIIIPAYYAVFTDPVSFGIPAGLYDPFAFAGTYRGPFAVFTMQGPVDLDAPAFVCGKK